MSTTKRSWEASTWDELKSLTTLDEVKGSLLAKEKNRLYHKQANLKKSAILALAKERGLDKEV
jgi:hypothetical protein